MAWSVRLVALGVLFCCMAAALGLGFGPSDTANKQRVAAAKGGTRSGWFGKGNTYLFEAPVTMHSKLVHTRTEHEPLFLIRMSPRVHVAFLRFQMVDHEGQPVPYSGGIFLPEDPSKTLQRESSRHLDEQPHKESTTSRQSFVRDRELRRQLASPLWSPTHPSPDHQYDRQVLREKAIPLRGSSDGVVEIDVAMLSSNNASAATEMVLKADEDAYIELRPLRSWLEHVGYYDRHDRSGPRLFMPCVAFPRFLLHSNPEKVQILSYFSHKPWDPDYPQALQVHLPPCEHRLVCSKVTGCVRDGQVSHKAERMHDELLEHKKRALTQNAIPGSRHLHSLIKMPAETNACKMDWEVIGKMNVKDLHARAGIVVSEAEKLVYFEVLRAGSGKDILDARAAVSSISVICLENEQHETGGCCRLVGSLDVMMSRFGKTSEVRFDFGNPWRILTKEQQNYFRYTFVKDPVDRFYSVYRLAAGLTPSDAFHGCDLPCDQCIPGKHECAVACRKQDKRVAVPCNYPEVLDFPYLQTCCVDQFLDYIEDGRAMVGAIGEHVLPQVYFLASNVSETPIELDFVGDANQLQDSMSVLGLLRDMEPLPSLTVDVGAGCDFLHSNHVAHDMDIKCAHPTTTHRDPIITHETGHKPKPYFSPEPGTLQKICRIYKDDYRCLGFDVPEVCKPII